MLETVAAAAALVVFWIGLWRVAIVTEEGLTTFFAWRRRRRRLQDHGRRRIREELEELERARLERERGELEDDRP